MTKTFRDLKVWQKSHDFTFIPTNIVEGFKRRSTKEYSYFLNIADSSLEETKYHLILSLDLEYLSNKDSKKLENYVMKSAGC